MKSLGFSLYTWGKSSTILLFASLIFGTLLQWAYERVWKNVHLNKISQAKLAYVTSAQIKKSEECQHAEAPRRQLREQPIHKVTEQIP